MNNKEKKQAILEKIREVCGLKRLEFGCEVLVGFEEYQERVNVILNCADGSGFYTNGNYEEKLSIFSSRMPFEIIGLPVELNHLLVAINYKYNDYPVDIRFSKNNINISYWKDFALKVDQLTEVEEPFWKEATYNLSLSVEQNLDDNPALTDLIYELIV